MTDFKNARFAAAVSRLAALWVLSVTSIKLFKGSPNDLPLIIRDNFFGPQWNFNLSIGVELSSALLALLWPRGGGVALAALLALFVAVLVYLIAQGATSCGCFGGAITVPPWAMLLVDGSLLAIIITTKPWSSLAGKKPHPASVAVIVCASFCAPWLLIHSRVLPVRGSQEKSATAAWTLPPKPWPRYVDLPVAKWAGRSIRETELAAWMNTEAFPSDDNRWVIYLHSCEHCRDYLRSLYNANPIDPDLVLVEIEDDRPRVVDLVPETPWRAELTNEIQWVITPPWELQVHRGVIQEAQFRGSDLCCTNSYNSDRTHIVSQVVGQRDAAKSTLRKATGDRAATANVTPRRYRSFEYVTIWPDGRTPTCRRPLSSE